MLEEQDVQVVKSDASGREDQPAAAQVSVIDIPLDHTQAMPLVELALTPRHLSKPLI